MGQVRNFWIKARIDGRQTELEGGPRSREGEFSQTIYIRDAGSIVTGVNISGRVDREGKPRLHCGDRPRQARSTQARTFARQSLRLQARPVPACRTGLLYAVVQEGAGPSLQRWKMKPGFIVALGCDFS